MKPGHNSKTDKDENGAGGIGKRNSAEGGLKGSEEKYRKLFETALDAIFLADAETGIIIDCNPAACALVGREKSELLGKHQKILHPQEEIDGEFNSTFKQHLKEKEGQILETQVITKKGEIRDVAIKANLFEVGGKEIMQGMFRDITDRKRARKELEKSKRVLEAKNRELAAFNKMAVGREEKMVELKEKIKGLEEELRKRQ